MSWIIDRFEDHQMAVLEHSSTGEQKIISTKNLPPLAKESTALIANADFTHFTIDNSEQAQQRHLRIADKFNRLVRKSKNP
ncbi:MAG: DUF3006 domain-containing protein [Firmicutes bacterium]|nr:DUF3006 domain-containing protein [Bacillota bacterium]